ncbi:MAG: histidine kinase N-terminal 7TM domain-containing protein [Treponemataceae bacterium]
MSVPEPFQFYFFIVCAVLLVAALVPASVFVARQGRIGRGSGAQRELSWFLRACIGYLIANSLEILTPTESSTMVFTSICYLFIASCPTWWFLFALEYGEHVSFARRIRPFMWIIPVAAFVMIATNPYHRLNWADWVFFKTGPFFVVRAVKYGPWFWFLWLYLQTLVIAGAVVVFSAILNNARSINKQTFIIAFGALIPITINGVFVLRLIPGFQKDFSPVAFSLAGLVFTFGVFYQRLFDVIPIARRVLVEALSDPLIALDDEGRVVDANPAARKVCRMGERALGTTAAGNPFLKKVIERMDELKGDAVEESPDGVRWFEVRAEFVQAGGRKLRLFAMRDVTERRALIEKLSAALSEIKSLEGIIPICASCKKIRDDKGYWQQVENYVSSHSRAQFSHGLCPDCRKIVYPQVPDTDE